MKVELDIDWDDVVKMIRMALIEDLTIYPTEDEKMRKALLKTLKYYSNPDEWKEFKEEYDGRG